MKPVLTQEGKRMAAENSAETQIKIYSDAAGETHVDSNMAAGQTPSAMILAALGLMEHQEGHALAKDDFVSICETLWDYHHAVKKDH